MWHIVFIGYIFVTLMFAFAQPSFWVADGFTILTSLML